MSNLITIPGDINTINSTHTKGILASQLRVKDILSIYSIDREVNRDLGYHRLPKIVRYLEAMDSEVGVFLPALVFSFREEPTKYYQNNTLSVTKDNELVVIDGQHRIKGLEKLTDKDSIDYEKREDILNSFLTVQIYFGLSIQDERKLFADINSNAKRVSRSLITKYDTRDILNIFVNQLYNASNALQAVGVEFNKSRIVRPKNTSFITSVRLKNFISYVLFGKKSLSRKNEAQIKEQYDELFSFFHKLFLFLFDTLPKDPGNVLKHVLGHEPMQNAIALHIHESIILENEQEIRWVDTWEEEVEQLSLINWSVNNRDWQPYLMDSRQNSDYEYKSFIETSTLDLKEILKKRLL